jgi:hypothetical protein
MLYTLSLTHEQLYTVYRIVQSSQISQPVDVIHSMFEPDQDHYVTVIDCDPQIITLICLLC